jgi:hypothetical protein
LGRRAVKPFSLSYLTKQRGGGGEIVDLSAVKTTFQPEEEEKVANDSIHLQEIYDKRAILRWPRLI